MKGYRNPRVYPEATVEQCLCCSGHIRTDCPYYQLPYQPKPEYYTSLKKYYVDDK